MTEPKIIVEGVSKEFTRGENGVLALDKVDLRVKEGEFVSIVGPSGCGKSTLLYMLGGFIPASTGQLLADGKAITKPGVDRGIVFQEYALFPWLTVFDNIAYGLNMKGSSKAALYRPDRARRLRAPFPAGAVRRHETARGACADLRL